MSSSALDGLVVADFSRVLSGPLATMMLGDLGADVIKVERPIGGDDTRAWGPPFHDGQSTYYLAVNRNKRSIALDLSTPAGLASARALVARADVLVENFRPGTLDRLGLGYDALSQKHPGLVYCSISGFGSQPPGRALPGYDFLVQAVGGLMSITGEPGGSGQKAGVALVDVITGLHAVIGIQAALRARDASGRGQHVELNLMSSLLASMVNQASAFLATNAPPQAMGNRHPSIVPYETLETADRPIAVAVGTNDQFAALCQVLGRSELASDPRFTSNPKRVENREALVGELGSVLRTAEASSWIARLDRASLPAGQINDLQEAFRFAEQLGLTPLMPASNTTGPVIQVANPISLPGSPPAYRRPPPRLGEHTAEILEWLSPPTNLTHTELDSGPHQLPREERISRATTS